MPSLTSCYFCGEAVGASLDEYAIPDGAPSERQVSVTLCANCHSKLTELLQTLPQGGGTSNSTVANDDAPAADADATPPSTQEDSGPAATDTEGSDTDESNDDDTLVGEPSTGVAAADDLDPVGTDTKPIFADDDGTHSEDDVTADDSADVAADRPFGDADPSDGPTDDEPASHEEPDPDDSSNAESTGAEATSTEPVVTASSPEPDSTGGPGDESDAGTRSEATTPPAATQQSSRADRADKAADTDDGPLSDVSPRTYNRVVRLLQNREFPVDRADFEALATSAYELDHGECTAALDGAIEKGLLVERDGALHRPE